LSIVKKTDFRVDREDNRTSSDRGAELDPGFSGSGQKNLLDTTFPDERENILYLKTKWDSF
jgi:hypothetical protein